MQAALFVQTIIFIVTLIAMALSTMAWDKGDVPKIYSQIMIVVAVCAVLSGLAWGWSLALVH